MARSLTTAIPYVNGDPHLGFGMEMVQTDTLARHWKHRGHATRFLSGTDDNSLKNARAAESENIPTAELVARNAAKFRALQGPLQVKTDDFISTSTDPRHSPGVARLWKAAEASGDLYRKRYEGLYCVGCEQFYTPDELTPEGLCPEHLTAPEHVAEENWFFRLSRYEDRLRELIESGTLHVEPEQRKNEVLGFIKGGLQDFSVSRTRERAHNWGIPVPGDDTQVIYVWYDALVNYISALGFGGDDTDYQRWWVSADRRAHIVGKGIIKFHCIYWPAMLMSAGQPLPTHVYVHDYLTVGGKKLGKSLGNAIDPVAIVDEYGSDALRWWFLRDVPRVGDADYTPQRLIDRYQNELANGVGNLLSRTANMVIKYRDGYVPDLAGSGPELPLTKAIAEVQETVNAAMERFDFRAATGGVWRVVDEANKLVNDVEPWNLAKSEKKGDADAGRLLSNVLTLLVQACRVVGDELTPFLPVAAERIAAQLDDSNGPLKKPAPLFPRIEVKDETAGV